MGRPRLTREEKKSVTITFRLSKKEKQELEQAAGNSGLATGIFIREKLFKGRFPHPKVAQIDTGVYLELKKIGVNINQVTRQVNAGKIPASLMTVLARLMVQQEQIIRMLINDRDTENR